MDGSGFSTLNKLRVCEVAVYRGPNVFGERAMVRIRIDLGMLEMWPSNRLDGFADKLVAAIPSLKTHACSLGHEGGFVERLHEGTWLGHVIEHVAIELQCLAGVLVEKGKTRSVRGLTGVYDILYEYKDEEVGRLAGACAIQLVDSLLPPTFRGALGAADVHEDVLPDASVESVINALQTLHSRTGLGPTTASIVDEAVKRGIPAMRLDDDSLVQLGWGSNQKKIRASITSQTSHVAVEAACDKQLTRRLLDKAGLPVPAGEVVRSPGAAIAKAQRLGWPVVVKPLDGNHGRGVTTDIRSAEAVLEAFAAAETHGRDVIVERHFHGDDHRILVVDGEVVAAARRQAASVVGDGKRSIAELVEAVNLDPRRGKGHEKPMTRIRLDAAAAAWLARSSRTFDSVPALGERVQLTPTANMSTGGEAIDCTDIIHPDNATIASRAAAILGLDVAGVDFICPDISKSVRKTGGGIVEVNAAPGFRMHLAPSEGRPRNVAKAVVRMLFPDDRNGRIPVFALTGTNGKSTTARMLSHIFTHTGARVGLTTTSGIYINGDRILKADASGPRSARVVLQDPTVDVAILEIARGGLLREGLPYDQCDGAIVTNIAADHLGLKGIETKEDLAWVKSVVCENVGPRGVSVLNADDPLVSRMARRAGGRIAYFSLLGHDMPGHLVAHIDNGGAAMVYDRRTNGIYIYQDAHRRELMLAADIPATLGGEAEFNIANALAAALLAISHGVAIDTVRRALASFGATFEQNPGRLNIHDGHGFRVVFDYAHNAHGLSALGACLRKMGKDGCSHIGMITIPGDRRDDDIRELGAVAAGLFDTLVLREDGDLRGRNPGEVMRLLREGTLAAGACESAIYCVADEMEAATSAMRLAQPGDVVLLCPTDVDGMWELVKAFQPEWGYMADGRLDMTRSSEAIARA